MSLRGRKSSIMDIISGGRLHRVGEIGELGEDALLWDEGILDRC